MRNCLLLREVAGTVEKFLGRRALGSSAARTRASSERGIAWPWRGWPDRWRRRARAAGWRWSPPSARSRRRGCRRTGRASAAFDFSSAKSSDCARHAAEHVVEGDERARRRSAERAKVASSGGTSLSQTLARPRGRLHRGHAGRNASRAPFRRDEPRGGRNPGPASVAIVSGSSSTPVKTRLPRFAASSAGRMFEQSRA